MSDGSTQLATGADHAYFEGLQAGVVLVQSCASCGEVHWPAVFRCPGCGSWDHVWNPVRPEGKIFSWTRTWHDFDGPKGLKPPFVTVVVSLRDIEQVRLIGTVSPPDSDISIGDEVKARIETVEFLGRTIPALVWSRA